MEDENNITSNVTSDADTEAEPQRSRAEKGERHSIVWLWFGFKKSDTDQTTWISKTCRQQVVTSNSNTSNLFYHLKTRHEKQYRESEKMRQSTNFTSEPTKWRKEKKNTKQAWFELLFVLTVLQKVTNKRRKCHSFAFHSHDYQKKKYYIGMYRYPDILLAISRYRVLSISHSTTVK